MAAFKVPNEHVHGVMSLSGREGLIIDKQSPRAGVETQQKDALAKVRLPLGLNLQDILGRIDALAPELRKATKGLVPTFKGYALRVEKHAEALITAAMNPKEAEILGPAMGLASAS